MINLDKNIIDFYQSKALDASRMQLMLAQTQSVRTRRWWPAYATAAILCLALVANTIHQNSLVNERTEIALREAAMNHTTKLSMDFESTDLAHLNDNMRQLNFKMKLPSQIPVDLLPEALRLLGARYCTIAGNLAAHLRFSHADSDNQLSLFMTPIEEELKKMSSETMKLEGVTVRLWQEDGFFYALADSPVTL